MGGREMIFGKTFFVPFLADVMHSDKKTYPDLDPKKSRLS